MSIEVPTNDPPLSTDDPRRRPGLPALDVRVGSQTTFLARMVARAPQKPALARLNVFAGDDPALALLDACAAVLDTLAFYQERIANEGYLRTATELRSQLELARAVGYVPSGGVAATTPLCFGVDDSPGGPKRVPIPAGTRAQSVPGPGESARFFETIEAIEARPEWNAMRPLGAQPQDVDVSADGTISFVGLDGVSRVGAGSLHVAGIAAQVRRGDVLAIVRGSLASTATVLGVRTDLARGVTVLELDATSPDRVPALPEPLSLGLPDTGVPPSTRRPLDPGFVRDSIVAAVWDEESLQALLATQGWSPSDLLDAVSDVLAADDQGPGLAYAFRQRAGFFGNTAQPYASIALAEVPQRTIVERALLGVPGSDKNLALPGAPARVAQLVVDAVAGTVADPTKNWDADGGRTIWQADDGSSYSALGVSVHLERVVAEASPTTPIVIEDRKSPSGELVRRVFRVATHRERSLVGFRQQGRVSGLLLSRVSGEPLSSSDRDPTFRFRTATAHVASERLTLASLPVTEVVEEALVGAEPRGAKAVVLDRMVLGLSRGRTIVVRGNEPGATDDAPGTERVELATLVAVRHERGRTTLHFDRNLAFRYLRSTMTLCANVAVATHGETIAGEVLGNGRAELERQSFALSRGDLTYVRGDEGRGAAASLSVRVNDESWSHVPSFVDVAPSARVFTLRREEDGRSVIAFGDGRRGARLPSGQANVTATYQSGVGVGGNVAARAISVAVSRPLGLRDVVNPLPAAGGADPASVEEIRKSAPRATTTLERTISLRDFEEHVLDFDGIARARAELVWTGTSSIPFVTVAGPLGAAIPAGGEVQTALERSLLRSGDGRRLVRVGSYEPRSFGLDLLAWTAPGVDLERLEAEIRASLADAFGFAARELARSVTRADVLSVVQRVRSVDGATISRFRVLGRPPVVAGDAPPTLPAFGARWDRATRRVVPAELLLVDPASVVLTIKTSTP